MNKAMVVFALKEEFTPWRRRHRFARLANSPHAVSATSMGSIEIFVALAGAGARDLQQVAELTSHVMPSFGIVTGVAAGLHRELRPGDLLAAQSVSGPEAGETIASDPYLVDLAVESGAKRVAKLITLPRIARTAAEKAQLAGLGDAADMESLPIMTYWSGRGIPSLALRVVLDPVDMPMKIDFEAAMDAHGQVRLNQIMLLLARQPGLLPDFLHLARQSRRTLKTLAGFLDRFFSRQEWQSLAGERR